MDFEGPIKLPTIFLIEGGDGLAEIWSDLEITMQRK